MATENVIALPKPRKVTRKGPRPTAEPRPSSTRRRLATASAASIGLVAVAATALSLSVSDHLLRGDHHGFQTDTIYYQYVERPSRAAPALRD
jgi:hypothetical protein